MMNVMRKIIFSVFLIIFISPVFAQRQPWWFSLEQGKIMFRGSEYGAALLLFEDARRDRRAMYEQMERDFINLLSVVEVRRIGDSLDFVERYSYDRHYTAASKALEELYYRIPKENFKNSAASALQAFDKLKNYPEAEYWIGEIYRVEGELSLALAQYRRAYEMREVLENTDFSIDLQYKIAGLLKTRQEYNEMEKMYLSIIDNLDTLWLNARRAESNERTPVPYAQASSSFATQSMTRTLETEGIRRFLEMYRYNNNIVENAHRQLGFYYAATGRPTAQTHLMFAFLIQNTIIINEITKHQFDFTFSNLSELTEEINKNAILLSYIETVEYYKTAYYLAASLYRNGKTTVARNFWEFLASTPQAGEWYNRAVLQLRNPRMEPVVEMP
jgi:tetratricopeptide (TPR) repeat protein